MSNLPKMAYFWVKGLAGWQHSTIAPAVVEDTVPDEDGDGGLEGENDYLTATRTASDGMPDVPLSDQADVALFGGEV